MTSSRPARLTADDQAMLGWLGRVGFATAEQLQRRFAKTRATIYRRLGWMVAGQLLTHERPFRDAGVYVPTSRGLAWSPLGGTTPKVSRLTYTHDLAVVDVQIALELDGHVVRTIREMRHHTRQRARPTAAAEGRDTHVDYRVQLPGASGRWYYPDLVVEADRRWGIEIELTPKAPKRLRRIVRAWIAAPATQYAGVVYHANPATLPGLRAAVSAAHAQDFIHLRPLTPSTSAEQTRADAVGAAHAT